MYVYKIIKSILKNKEEKLHSTLNLINLTHLNKFDMSFLIFEDTETCERKNLTVKSNKIG